MALVSDGIEVVGEAGTAAEAFGRIHALDPDVAVLDVRLPDGDGVSVCREVRSRHPRTACLILTSFADDEALFDAIMAGEELRHQRAVEDGHGAAYGGGGLRRPAPRPTLVLRLSGPVVVEGNLAVLIEELSVRTRRRSPASASPRRPRRPPRGRSSGADSRAAECRGRVQPEHVRPSFGWAPSQWCPDGTMVTGRSAFWATCVLVLPKRSSG